MKKHIIWIVLLVCMQFLQAETLAEKRARLLTDSQLSNLTIDFGVIDCMQDGKRKYIVIDYVGTIYAVNGTARGTARKMGWKDAESILRKDGDHLVFSSIIDTAIKNGCRKYYHYKLK